MSSLYSLKDDKIVVEGNTVSIKKMNVRNIPQKKKYLPNSVDTDGTG